MAGVIYLDIDDEITSAAARIRGVDGRRVAVVLPYGSRVATSRINFRLLARDALTHEKRLAIVAGDAATRALAASAGLPVFASVGEYEEAMAAERGSRGASAGSAGSAGSVSAGPVSAGPAASRSVSAARRQPPAEPEDARSPLDRSETVVSPGVETAGAATTGTARRRRPDPAATIPLDLAADSASPEIDALAPRARPGRPLPDAGPASGPMRAPARVHPVPGGPWSGLGRNAFLVVLAVVGLAVLVAGVGAYLLLPSATAVVTPRQETIGPISLRIVASTGVTEPDVEAGTVPAQSIEVEVQAADTFPATGKRVEETKAKGAVRFRNYDPTSSNTIKKGSVVSTGAGEKFRTDAELTLPAAQLILGDRTEIIPSEAQVGVTAVDAGTDGNVEPNSITVVPRGENPDFLRVTNPEATSGGTRTVFPRVTRDDVDAAIAALTRSLEEAFADRLDDEDLVSGDATVFPETASLGPPVPSVDPDGLVGQEVKTFELGAVATGTVIAVDAAPVRTIAEARLQASVDSGHELVDGSSEITEAPAVVEGERITYPVVVTARQVAVLDPAVLESEIMGASVDDARTILERYGTVELDVWPDWVGTIPTLDSRVEVTVRGPVAIDVGEPEASP